MADKTGIEWADSTWNPIRGCSRVSEACRYCYAEDQAARIIKSDRERGVPEGAGAYDGLLAKGGQWNGKIRVVPELLDQPLRWSKPRRIFVNSMSDLFHENVPFEFAAAIFGAMAQARHHTFQVLTKRPARMLEFFDWLAQQTSHKDAWVAAVNQAEFICSENKGQRGAENAAVEACAIAAYYKREQIAAGRSLPAGFWPKWPLDNVWIGVSVEDQASANERIPLLLKTPAAVRWLSMEPLLGQIDLERIEEPGGDVFSATYGWHEPVTLARVRGVDWVVVGGESGPEARPMHPDWATALRDQCARGGVPFLFKQWGEWMPICEMTEEQADKAYKSKVKAKNPEDQAVMDEMHGRKCTVQHGVLQLDGALLSPLEPGAFKVGAMTVYRVGKTAAGRLLNGIQHDGYPVSMSSEEAA